MSVRSSSRQYVPGVDFLLWYSDTKDSLMDKVNRAVRRHNTKYGIEANVCFVHPSVTEIDIITPGVTIKPLRYVRPDYFLVGVENEQ